MFKCKNRQGVLLTHITCKQTHSSDLVFCKKLWYLFSARFCVKINNARWHYYVTHIKGNMHMWNKILQKNLRDTLYIFKNQTWYKVYFRLRKAIMCCSPIVETLDRNFTFRANGGRKIVSVLLLRKQTHTHTQQEQSIQHLLWKLGTRVVHSEN